MVYTKHTTAHEKSRRLLKGYDLNAPKLAVILGCSEPTARKKINDPGLLNGNEWLRINRVGKIPIEEIKEVILR